MLFVCNVLLAGRGLKQDPFSPRSMQDRQLDSQRKAQQQMDKMGEFDSLTVWGQYWLWALVTVSPKPGRKNGLTRANSSYNV
ncbi:hypothetical protein EPYR_01845 [Erwinia pyrifoliae DSM 12163]|nr:hypothetical protein EPYR_01845 [Erwinia pyrifoliae DSM 12163]